MALGAKQDERVEITSEPTQIVPTPRLDPPTSSMNGEEMGVKHTLRDITDGARKALETTKGSARKAYDQVQTRASRSYSLMVGKAQELGRRNQRRVRLLKEEHPLELIAIIAGAAFVFGIAIRIWRSRANG